MSERARIGALLLFALFTPLAFPHELPTGGAIDLGLGFAWLVPAALAIGIAGRTPRQAARDAFLASFAGHCLLFHWFAVVTVVYGGMPFALGILAPLVPALYVAPFTALFAAGWRAIATLGPAASIAAGAALWVAVDWLRGHLFGGFPWATLGYALHLDWPLLTWTRYGGVYALSFAAAAVGLALGRMVLEPGAAARRTLVVTSAGLAIAHALGWLGAEPREPDPAAPVARVAAVQGNVNQGEKWDAARRERIFAGYLRLSREAGLQGVDWIVWPETALPGLLEVDAELRGGLAGLVRQARAELMVGGMGIDLTPEGRATAYYDSAFHLDRTGRLIDRYDKTHLVPFGEFVPLRSLLGRFFQSLATGLASADVTRGTAPRALPMKLADGAAARVGVPICYELLFPHLVRRFAADGAGVLLAITNDAWYGRTGAPHQFLAMTALRAAENRRWTVRAANTGISAIIDGQGRVRSRSALFEEAVVVGEVPIADSGAATFYSRQGDVFAILCVVTSLGLGAFALWRGRQAEAPGGASAEDARGPAPGGISAEDARGPAPGGASAAEAPKRKREEP